MKSLRLLLVLLSSVFFFACTKEKSFEGGSSTTARWEFTEGSRLYKGDVDTAFVTTIGGINTFYLDGSSDDNSGFIRLGIINFNTTTTGVYRSPSVLFEYYKSDIIYENDVAAVDKFKIEITKIDSINVEGIFSGEVTDSTGALKMITNGKFVGRFKRNTPPAGDGRLMLWSKAGCPGGGNINVTLTNNQTGSITAFQTAAPNCGTAGTATFTLPAGTYGWKAKCGTDSTVGVVTVLANQCAIQEVIFGGTPQVGLVSFWAKNSCTAGGNINVRINNQNAAISSFSASAPATCTIAGNANFVLPVGTHSWAAKCGTDSIFGTVNVVLGQCAKVEVIFASGPAAQYTLVSSAGNCSNYQVLGTFIAGKPLHPDTNAVVLQVNVTTPGSYTISTNSVNGYSFSASGTFAATGVQNVTLKSAGTPVTAGANSFTVTAGASTCSFPITVISPPPGTSTNSWSFTQGTKNYSGLFPVGGDFIDDFFGLGKALDMFGEIPNTDTSFYIYVQFPATATQPIPGTYITDPNIFSNNTTDWGMYDANDDVFYVKSLTGAGSPVKMTIVISSYDPVTKIVKGTFSGQAWNTAGQVVNVSNGKFETVVNF